jgi:prevent-host-death family protein
MPDDVEQRIANNDFGDAEMVTTRELREKLSEIIGRCAYGGDRFVVKRNGKPVAAVVPIEDMFVAQYVEDQLDIRECERQLAAGELEHPTPLDEVVERFGP